MRECAVIAGLTRGFQGRADMISASHSADATQTAGRLCPAFVHPVAHRPTTQLEHKLTEKQDGKTRLKTQTNTVFTVFSLKLQRTNLHPEAT